MKKLMYSKMLCQSGAVKDLMELDSRTVGLILREAIKEKPTLLKNILIRTVWEEMNNGRHA